MISIIFCSVDESKAQRIENHYQALLGNEPHEIIIIRDAKSLAEAYNRALLRAHGDTIIFSHDDIEFLAPQDWLYNLKRHMARFDIMGVAGTSRLVEPGWIRAGPPYIYGQVAGKHQPGRPFGVALFSPLAPPVSNIQALDGLFFVVRRHVLETVQFDEERFDGFHFYDIDFTYSSYLAGFKLAVATDLPIFHQSGGNFNRSWDIYAQRFMDKHTKHLFKMEPRRFLYSIVEVETKNELLDIMTPQATQQV